MWPFYIDQGASRGCGAFWGGCDHGYDEAAFALPAGLQRRLAPLVLRSAPSESASAGRGTFEGDSAGDCAGGTHSAGVSSDSASDATTTTGSADASERRPYQQRGARRQSGVATTTRTATGPVALQSAERGRGPQAEACGYGGAALRRVHRIMIDSISD